MSEVYLDENGNPKDRFIFSVSEKIGLPNYSSVELFASISRHVGDDEDERQAVVNLVEDIMAKERSIVLSSIEAKK